MVTSTSTIRSLHQYAVLYNCSLAFTMKNYNNKQRSAHTKNRLFLMTFSSTSFQLNSSGKQQTKSLWHVWRSHSRSRPHICRLTVWKHRRKRGTEIASMFVIRTLEIQWGTEPEHGKLEEIPNMAIIPWWSMFHFDVFFTSGRFSSHHPIFHLPLGTLQRYPSSTCGVGIRQVGLQQSDHCQG